MICFGSCKHCLINIVIRFVSNSWTYRESMILIVHHYQLFLMHKSYVVMVEAGTIVYHSVSILESGSTRQIDDVCWHIAPTGDPLSIVCTSLLYVHLNRLNRPALAL